MSFVCFVLTPTAVAATIALGVGVACAATCAPKGADPVDAVRGMYSAAMVGDRAKTIAEFDRDGYLFDGGERFTPESIAGEILDAEAAGTTFYWRVDGPESHVSCDLAWATWTNHGTFTKAAIVDHKTWLESAVFVWADGSWKIRFFHSSPVRTPSAAKANP